MWGAARRRASYHDGSNAKSPHAWRANGRHGVFLMRRCSTIARALRTVAPRRFTTIAHVSICYKTDSCQLTSTAHILDTVQRPQICPRANAEEPGSRETLSLLCAWVRVDGIRHLPLEARCARALTKIARLTYQKPVIQNLRPGRTAREQSLQSFLRRQRCPIHDCGFVAIERSARPYEY